MGSVTFTGAGRRDVVHDADVLGVSPRAEAKSMLVGVGPVSDSLRGEPSSVLWRLWKLCSVFFRYVSKFMLICSSSSVSGHTGMLSAPESSGSADPISKGT